MASSALKMISGMVDRAKSFDGIKAIFSFFVPEDEIINAPLHVEVKNNHLAATGEETEIFHTAGSDTGKFEIWEAGDIIASHDPLRNFAKNERYPEGVQERQYHTDVNEQIKVKTNASRLNPTFLVNTNPDAVNGPPILTKSGVVLGGNSRTMSIIQAYNSIPEKAEAYKQSLKDNAKRFGLTTGDINAFERPVLVRVIDNNYDTEEMKKMSRYYNQNMTQGLDELAVGLSKANLVSQETLNLFAEAITQNDDEDMTLNKFLDTAGSKKLIERLIEDGVIETTSLSVYLNKKTGLLTQSGKRLVESVFRGIAIDDYDLLATLPAETLQKLDRCIPALAKVKARGGKWDIMDKVKRALALVASLSKEKEKSPEPFLAQASLFDEWDNDKRDQQIVDIFRLFCYGTQKQIAEAWRRYAQAALSNPEGTAMLPGIEPPSPKKTAHKIFGGTVDKLMADKNIKKMVVLEGADCLVLERANTDFDWRKKLDAIQDIDELSKFFFQLFQVPEINSSKSLYDRLVAGEFNQQKPVPYLLTLEKVYKEQNKDVEKIKEPCKRWVGLHEDWLL